MNDNVKIADERVSRIRYILSKTTDQKIVGIKIEELLDYLHCLERLAVLERHLYNLTSDGYKVYAHA